MFVAAYMCHGFWQDNNTHYLIASPVARKSTDALRYCLVYHFVGPQPLSPTADRAVSRGPTLQGPTQWEHAAGALMRLSAVAGSCHRYVNPGVSGVFAFNFTTNGEYLLSYLTRNETNFYPLFLIILAYLSIQVICLLSPV